MQSLFLNHKILEETLKSTMQKYGLQGMDPEVMVIISEAMKNKFAEIIKDLIKIHRAQN